MSTQNYNQATKLLTRNKVEALAIGAGVTVTEDVQVDGASTLVVMVEMSGGAIGDLAVELWPFEADNTTVQPQTIPPANAVGPTLNAAKVYYTAEFDVAALAKVQIRIKNNNVGAQTINRYSWRAS